MSQSLIFENKWMTQVWQRVQFYFLEGKIKHEIAFMAHSEDKKKNEKVECKLLEY